MKTLFKAIRPPSIPPSDDPWGRALRRGAVAYIVSRIVVVMGASIAVAAEAVTARVNEEEPKGGLSALVQVFDSWDGHWYLDVVREGYPHHIMPNVTYFVSDARAAFFPMYPRLVHYLDNIIPGGPVSVALLVNLFLGALFIYLIGRIARDLFDVKTAEKAMIIAALFPGSFVISMAYSEALMLVISCLCFMALSKKAWVWAGVLAWKALIAPILAPVGFISFMLFLAHHTDENFAWFRVQTEAWKEGTSFGATAVSRTFDFFLNPTSSPTTVLTAASMAAMILALWCLKRYRIPAMYIAFTVGILVLMLLPATVTARPRFLFTAFPLIFPVARQLRDDDDKWWPLVLIMFATGLVTVMGMYGVRAAIP
jgi:hypothetical protein